MKIRSLLIAAVAMSALASGAAAQSASADVDAKAKFVVPLAITGGAALDFGTALTPNSAATITITPAGARTASGATLLASANGSAASFGINAEGGQAFGLAFAQTSALSGYTLSNFTASGCDLASPTALTTTLTGTGSQNCTLTVGATLAVPAGASGTKDLGQLQTTITYN